MIAALGAPLVLMRCLGGLQEGRWSPAMIRSLELLVPPPTLLRERQGLEMELMVHHTYVMFFPGGLQGKESACSAGDLGSIPGSGRSPGEGDGNPLQNSCLKNPMDRGAWRATVLGVAKGLLRDLHFHFLS